MSDDVFADRRRALEESFFHEKNKQLLEQLRTKLSAETHQQVLAAALGVHDPKVLADLYQAGVTNETLAALFAVPMIAVAWADGKLDDKERQAILKSVEEAGVPADSPPYKLLQGWLNQRPEANLFTAWREYVSAMLPKLEPAAKAEWKQAALRRARQVAAASGGVLGIGSVSAPEQAVLQEIEAAFG